MQELLKMNNVTFDIQHITMLDQINIRIQKGDRIGIIGKNGTGKSTLLKLIAKDITPTKGDIQWVQTNLRIAFVEQEIAKYHFDEETPLESILLGKWNVPNQPYDQLSGGEKLKRRLAKGFSQEADLVLLDEPTNHLDTESTEMLMELIENYKGTVIMVSHDRHFLDTVVTKIWSIEDKQIIEHRGNYSSYIKEREQKRLIQQRAFEKQQKMVEQIESQMRDLTSWSKKAHAQSTQKEGIKEHYRVKAKRMDAQVKSKRKRLEKELEKVKVEPVELDDPVDFSIQTNHKVGKRFLEVKSVTKEFHGRVLFQNVNFTIQHGEKIAIVGANGSGKTTLLNILLGIEPVQGEVWVSPSANIGYLTQEVFDLPLEKSPEQLFYRETFAARGKVQTLMKHLGFTASQWKEPVKNMSMGERVKCKLMRYILEEKDVLILDEPTNHLDLPSREQLEQTLALYNGTLLIVSHDRYFLEKTTTHQLMISNHQIQKQFKDVSKKKDQNAEDRLKLETERQEILGRLSFMTSEDERYSELDRQFKELTKLINALS